MDFLFAKTKGRTGTFRKVLSDETLFNDIPDFTESRIYNDEVKLYDNEWFVVENFSDKVYAPQLIRERFNPALWSQIGRTDYDQIDFLVSIQNEGSIFIFQNITSSLIYRRQRWLSFDEQPTVLEKDHLLVIRKNADAYYFRNEDRLYFKRLSAITGIFQGINELYNEATDDEVEAALSLDILNVNSNYTKEDVKTANRRRIREAMDMYNSYTADQKRQLPLYLQKYCPMLSFNATTSKFEITDEKTLTQLLNGLCQRYYTTEISNEKRVALSVEEV